MCGVVKQAAILPMNERRQTLTSDVTPQGSVVRGDVTEQGPEASSDVTL